MSSSLLSGISGLASHQEMINVVANNIANANTAGYKSRRALFSDLMYRTLTEASGPIDGGPGSIDPTQVGMGTRIARVATQFSQGNLSPSSQPLDLGLDGEGFFMLDTGSRHVYTRVGSFGLDKDGYLVDPITGYYVQRHGSIGEPNGVDPAFQVSGDMRIQVPLGQVIPGVPVSEVNIIGNLNTSSSLPQAQQLATAFPLESGANPATSSTLLNLLDSNNAGLP